MIFEHPLYAWLATALVVLLLLYWLHKKVRTCVVPALFLWLGEKNDRRPGGKIHPHRLPLTFYLECAILLLLVAAAMSPLLPHGKESVVLTVILDNSYSMRAKDSTGRTAKDKILKLLEPVTAYTKANPVRLLLAGETVRNLGEFTNPAEFQAAVQESFQCTESTSQLAEAVALARKLDPINLFLNIYTDHMPPATKELPANTVCHLVGETGANTAIVRALRTQAGDKDKILLLLSGSGDQAVPFKITELGSGAELATGDVTLTAGRAQVSIAVPANSQTLLATIGKSDVLDFDDTATLLPEAKAQVLYRLDLTDSSTADAVTKALDASEYTLSSTSEKCDLFITNKANATNATATTILRIITSPTAESSPAVQFAVTRSHQLTEGMILDGVIWAGVPETPLPGEALIRTGTKVPLSCYRNTAGQLEIVMAIDLKRSTLTRMSAWPVFFANITEATSERLFANNRHNFADDEIVKLAFPAATETVRLTQPDATETELKLDNGLLQLSNLPPGRYEVRIPDGRQQEFQVQSANVAESDLTTAETKTVRAPSAIAERTNRFVSLAPFLILAALLLGALHQYHIWRKRNAIR